MKITEVIKFCNNVGATPQQREAFIVFLRLKYGNRLPKKLTPDLAWRQFLAEVTSRVL